MKKNLIAVAVAAAFITPAVSMADVTAYGIAQVELSNTSYELSSDDDKLELIDNAQGRVGLKATEDLGDGWTGLAKFEFKADTVDNNTLDNTCTIASDAVDVNGNPATITCDTSKAKASLVARESMVGLKGSIGQIELGDLKSAYKYTGGVKYDIFVATQLEARAGATSAGGGMSGKPKNFSQFGHAAFMPATIGYRNKVGPINLSLTYGPGTDDSSYTLSALYSEGGIEAFVAVVDTGDLGKAKKNSYTATKVGGKFTTGAHTIMAQIENTDVEVASVTTSPAFMYLAYQLKMGPNIFAVQYGTLDVDGVKDTTTGKVKDETYMALGVVHKMSKETRIYAGYKDVSTDYKAGGSIITAGLRKDF
jgi:predicted porin